MIVRVMRIIVAINRINFISKCSYLYFTKHQLSINYLQKVNFFKKQMICQNEGFYQKIYPFYFPNFRHNVAAPMLLAISVLELKKLCFFYHGK